jgi:hypothetical protein
LRATPRPIAREREILRFLRSLGAWLDDPELSGVCDYAAIEVLQRRASSPLAESVDPFWRDRLLGTRYGSTMQRVLLDRALQPRAMMTDDHVMDRCAWVLSLRSPDDAIVIHAWNCATEREPTTSLGAFLSFLDAMEGLIEEYCDGERARAVVAAFRRLALAGRLGETIRCGYGKHLTWNALRELDTQIAACAGLHAFVGAEHEPSLARAIAALDTLLGRTKDANMVRRVITAVKHP